MPLAQIVRRQRQRQKLTRQKLSDRSGVSVVTIERIENRRILHPREETLFRLATALDVDVEELLEPDPV